MLHSSVIKPCVRSSLRNDWTPERHQNFISGQHWDFQLSVHWVKNNTLTGGHRHSPLQVASWTAPTAQCSSFRNPVLFWGRASCIPDWIWTLSVAKDNPELLILLLLPPKWGFAIAYHCPTTPGPTPSLKWIKWEMQAETQESYRGWAPCKR